MLFYQRLARKGKRTITCLLCETPQKQQLGKLNNKTILKSRWSLSAFFSFSMNLLSSSELHPFFRWSFSVESISGFIQSSTMWEVKTDRPIRRYIHTHNLTDCQPETAQLRERAEGVSVRASSATATATRSSTAASQRTSSSSSHPSEERRMYRCACVCEYRMVYLIQYYMQQEKTFVKLGYPEHHLRRKTTEEVSFEYMAWLDVWTWI